LDYCVPLGIPHSVFLGRAVGPDGPQWLDEDREKALAWHREKAQHCPHCGTRRDAWEQSRTAYIGQLDTCWGCELLEHEQKNVPEAQRGYVRPYLVPEHLLPPNRRIADVEGR
jgi:hypothetical protein